MKQEATLAAIVAKLYRRERISVFYHALLGLLAVMGAEVAVVLAIFWVLFQRGILDLSGDFWLPQLLLAMPAVTALSYASVRACRGSRLRMLQRLDRTHDLCDLLGTAYSLGEQKHRTPLAPLVIGKAQAWLERYAPPPVLRPDRKWWIFPVLALAFAPWAIDNPATGGDDGRIASESSGDEATLNPPPQTGPENDHGGDPPQSPPETTEHPHRRESDENTPGETAKRPGKKLTGNETAGENQSGENSDGHPEKGRDGPGSAANSTEDNKIERHSGKERPDHKPGKEKKAGPDEIGQHSGKNQPDHKAGKEKKADPAPERKVPRPRQNSSPNRHGRSEDGRADDKKLDAPPPSPHDIRPLFSEGENRLSRQWADVWDPDGQDGATGLDPASYQRFAHQAEIYLRDSRLPAKHRRSIQRYFSLIRPDNY